MRLHCGGGGKDLLGIVPQPLQSCVDPGQIALVKGRLCRFFSVQLGQTVP